MSDIKVSVCIISYNQDKYIRDCLDGVFSQKTDFKFEVIIRDDCSQDSTVEVINKYIDNLDNDKKERIKITLLDGSQNIGANDNFLTTFNASVGHWLAICEGDDYWCDKTKLQKQYDYVTINTDCAFVVHPAFVNYNDNIRKIEWACTKKKINYVGDIIRNKGQFAPTGSYFFKKEIINVLPNWFSTAPVGDFYMEIYATSLGTCHSISDYMSVYRISSSGSWSDLLKNDKNGQRIINTYMLQRTYLDKLSPLFPSFIDDITIKKSHASYAAAMGYLANQDYYNFRLIMSESYTKSWYDMMHCIFYYLRKNKFLSMLAYRLKPIIKAVILRRT